ncbi:uncharacterized protein ACNS7B_003042 [Menidia menidia]
MSSARSRVSSKLPVRELLPAWVPRPLQSSPQQSSGSARKLRNTLHVIHLEAACKELWSLSIRAERCGKIQAPPSLDFLLPAPGRQRRRELLPASDAPAGFGVSGLEKVEEMEEMEGTRVLAVLVLLVSQHASAVEVKEGVGLVSLPCSMSSSELDKATVVWSRLDLNPPTVHLRRRGGGRPPEPEPAVQRPDLHAGGRPGQRTAQPDPEQARPPGQRLLHLHRAPAGRRAEQDHGSAGGPEGGSPCGHRSAAGPPDPGCLHHRGPGCPLQALLQESAPGGGAFGGPVCLVAGAGGAPPA